MKDSIFLNFSIKEIIEQYKNKTISPVDVAKSCINYVEKIDPKYLVWEAFDPDFLLKQARASENLILNGNELRSLEGIPVGVKDIINTKDFSTQMGSPIWKDFTPGNDARVVYNLKQNGAIIAGKTVSAEFGVHALGKTLNPHDISLSPGTSSSGSAVAISTGMVPVSLGTQTAGSIVRPASFCGVYGIKPSFGLMPRTGVLKTTDSLDTLGFFTTFFEDIERVFNELRVHGLDYPISDSVLNSDVRQSRINKDVWKVGFVRTHVWDDAETYAKKQFIEFIKKLSFIKDVEIEEVELPIEIERAHEIHATIYNKNLSYYFREESKKNILVSPVMNELVSQGERISVNDYQTALNDQEQLYFEMDKVFGNYDILLSLSTAGTAPKRDVVEAPDSALIWNMTYLPVISAPVFKNNLGLPFGLQLISRRYNDLLLFKFAQYIRDLNYIPKSINPEFNNLIKVEKTKELSF